MPDTSSAAASTPVVFLNPEIVIDPPVAVRIGVEAVVGYRGSPSFPNQTADRLNELCRALAAPLVLTNASGLVDMRDRLLCIGVRGFHPLDWLTNQSFPDRASAVARWRTEHGDPPAIVIDRPGFPAAAGMAVIEVPATAELTRQACDQALAALGLRHE